MDIPEVSEIMVAEIVTEDEFQADYASIWAEVMSTEVTLEKVPEFEKQIRLRYQDLFQEPNGLPPSRRDSDFRIRTITGMEAPHKAPDRMTPTEFDEWKKQTTELLGKRLIRLSRGSPYAAPAIFVPKGVDAEGRPQLRMVIDYRDLNRITVKDPFPLPHPEDLINRLTGMKRFSKLDFFSGYHQHRMHPDSIEKTAFIGPDGLYEWLVMPFGLANAPSEFMRLVNKMLEQPSKYCIVFLDDIMIFSRTDAEHEKHVATVLDTLRRKGFRLKESKCAFGPEEALFFGFEVDGAGVSMTEEKVKAISHWPDPETPKEMRIFVGLTGVYRRFVSDYAKIAAPLLDVMTLTQSEYDRMKSDPIRWKQITVAVDLLKAAMIARPALALPQKGNHQFIVRTDASDFAIGGTLRQL
jgi:hypothetical protein